MGAGYVAIVFARGGRRGLVTALHSTRAGAAAEAFKHARRLDVVMTERRERGAACGSDIQWVRRRDLLAPLSAADIAARRASVPGAV